ncbi:hypothetical protein CMU14_13275 [Elizabethkingia anophelis]|nr:hypothetical protein [Elizabethkingia anophelis]
MNGKSKEVFEKWFEKEYRTFTTYYAENVDKINNHIIVEWLDMVKLNVYVVPVKDGWFSCIKNGDNDLTHGLFIDRESATEAAIKKAVEIYNARFS